jgi:hypothetical protein
MVGPTIALSSILLTSQLSSLSKPQNTMPPLVHLEIAARLKTDQTLPGLFLLILDCTAGNCSLVRISLNECRSFDRNQAPAFVPAAERATTWDQTLTVTPTDGAFIVEEAVSDAMASQSKIAYRFEYAKADPAKPITTLTGFSGSFTRNGGNRPKVEFVPLNGASQQVQLDCAVRLPGIP